ncbi:hypothetical protein GBW32_20125 [Streptomyces tsukubensis]|uniref:Uncharacterized protein n=1 Tax=Streptomyces tsukubensis TaxID=83656 RepID=A0A1V4ACF3_9ACTN|nr:hypothetical protein B1H18_09740 [Streptomyces tsukubensis]QFR94918.1 hypothetical protein GBW32_20125 [Streptomyces tsukubensis]
MIIDAETGERIDVRPDRTAQALIAWPREHPGAGGRTPCGSTAGWWPSVSRSGTNELACPQVGPALPAAIRRPVPFAPVPHAYSSSPVDRGDSPASVAPFRHLAEENSLQPTDSPPTVLRMGSL